MAAASRSVKASIEMRERHYPPLTFVSGYGYPYCLGRFVPVVQDRDPKFIYPSSPDFSNTMVVEMPHDIYLWMMKWSNRKVKEWWSGEIVNDAQCHFRHTHGFNHSVHIILHYSTY